MNVKKILVLLVINYFRTYSCGLFSVASEEDDFEFIQAIGNDENSGNGQFEMFSGTLYKTVKRYRCCIDSIEDSSMLIYGTKAWTFPLQDVSLMLSYPEANRNETDSNRFLITSIEVVLYLDGSESKGYITSGGILQESINLKFTVSNITMLSYQFWLHGIPNTQVLRPDLNDYTNLCT